MLRILTVIGARPQIIKASAINRAVRTEFKDQVEEVIVHTGQHYDEQMSQIFFEELQIPVPNYNLSVGSGPHGRQTAKMIAGLEEVLEKETVDYLIVYGDTNSTLAAAIAASKVYAPIVHIEAGLRSFDKKMPEEVNRILCDHVSTFLFPPTQKGMDNLRKEGFNINQLGPYDMNHPGVFNFGDVMYDNSLHFKHIAQNKSRILQDNEWLEESFVLVTVHRASNTENLERLNGIFHAILRIANEQKVVLPLHPRTLKVLQESSTSIYSSLQNHAQITLLPPVSFLDMVRLEQAASLIITDSGGVQKEAFFFEKPCIILRAQTEWVEIVDRGAAVLADSKEESILKAYQAFQKNPQIQFDKIYGDGNAAIKIIEKLLEQ